MRDALGPQTRLGYCTNVHAGASRDETLANLERHAVAVRERVCPGQPMGVGLWLSARAAREVAAGDGAARLAGWLAERGLFVFTLNGFPHGDFHEPRVKHRVYRPAWSERARVDYTRDLADVLVELLGDDREGSISTLPLGWRASARPGEEEAAAGHLLETARHLAELEQRRGKRIHLDLEPEPGCVLDTSDDVVRLFERYFSGAEADVARRHLGVCHDVCHAAVLFEDQAVALARYRAAGIGVGKIQVSSAIRVPFHRMDGALRRRALAALVPFAEERFLHQTVIRDAGGGTRFFDDLPAALASVGEGEPGAEEWRIHYHVPIHLERLGVLETTRDEVLECLAALDAGPPVRHFEVETYAWSVLPPELAPGELAQGIGEELEWLRACGTSGRR